ncbi:MAG: sugar phosphorylase [Anaerolineales bacterium]
MAAAVPDERALRERIAELLASLYGPQAGESARAELERLVSAHRAAAQDLPTPSPFGPEDVILICYPDQLLRTGEPPLQTLADWLERALREVVSGVHILPFFPSTSDDGFSVVDYRSVDPAYGTWQDILRIGSRFRLMVDAVLNHVSQSSDWFRGFVERSPPYDSFFHDLDPAADLSAVFRPREHALLTPVPRSSGTAHVWTTFSPDQVDLNYSEPRVMLAILDVLLFYARQRAQLIRLDAVAYLYKEIGTASVHLPQTHRLLKLMRAVLEQAAPGVRLISETNVPHRLNLTYFGEGDEAQLVYSFPLPPLLLHCFQTGDSSNLQRWSVSLNAAPAGCTFFNFLSSHDGIGLPGLDGILPEAEIEALVLRTRERGAAVSYRRAGDRRLPYELNTTFLDALSEPGELEAQPARAAARFLCAHAILLSLRGVPALYFHSLVGSRNDVAGAAATGRARALHREKFSLERLEREMNDPRLPRRAVWDGLLRWIALRRRHPAFHPDGPQEVLDLGREVFAIVRNAPRGEDRIVCLHEIAGRGAHLTLPPSTGFSGWLLDRNTSERFPAEAIPLGPYQARWLTTVTDRAAP